MLQTERQMAVSVRNLERRFGAFSAVRDLDLDVEIGEVFGFLGPNGAGKSTTIRMLCGLLKPTSGTGMVAGFDICRESESVKSRIGYMSQRFSLYDDLTVEQNIEFYAGIYGLSRAKMKDRKAGVLELAGLTERRHMRTHLLAGGLKQRLALGCAVLHEPPLLFLDEPTSGVDPLMRRQFWDLIYDLARGGTTIFVSTHFMDEAEYCDNIAFLYGGRKIASGSPRALKDALRSQQTQLRKSFTADPTLEDVFISLIEDYDRAETSAEGRRA